VPVSANSLTVKERAIFALDALPPLSPILQRVIASLAHEDISFAKVADLIEKDTVLAGAILRLVNSPLYGLRATVSSVRHAVSLLGVAELRKAVLGVSGAQMWRCLRTPRDWSMRSFNRHAVSVAVLTDLLAQQLPVDNSSSAFVAGLFHDLGYLLVAMGLPAEYDQILALNAQEPGRLVEHELAVLETTHAELSGEALAVWNFPPPIRNAVRYHLQPELDPGANQAEKIAMSRILHCADAYLAPNGTDFSAKKEEARGGEDVFECLGLGDSLHVALSEFDNEMAAIEPYF